MKKYKAIFFDWDGTAVVSRKAPVDEAVAAMKPLLEQGIKLVIVSGTTIENIAGGTLHKYFTKKQLDNLYLGLARGAYNYTYKKGEPYLFSDRIPDKSTLEAIHRTSFEIHMELKNKYGLDTDIVFSRPNYCKIDLMVGNDRGDALFMQADELTKLKEVLKCHGIAGGLQQLLDLSIATGEKFGIKAAPTCDAKYLEVGTTSKSDNTDAILNELIASYGIKPYDCAYFGDEFVGIEPGIYGSDSFMMTELSKAGDFYDVSDVSGTRPDGVEQIRGGVAKFLSCLRGMW